MARRLLFKNAVKRKPNCLYYIDGEGSIWEADLLRGRPAGAENKKKPKQETQETRKESAPKRWGETKSTVRTINYKYQR